MPAGWEYSRSPYPMPPRNTSANSPFLKGAIDLRWDSPSFIHENEGWIIRGVIYIDQIHQIGDLIKE